MSSAICTFNRVGEFCLRPRHLLEFATVYGSVSKALLLACMFVRIASRRPFVSICKRIKTINTKVKTSQIWVNIVSGTYPCQYFLDDSRVLFQSLSRDARRCSLLAGFDLEGDGLFRHVAIYGCHRKLGWLLSWKKPAPFSLKFSSDSKFGTNFQVFLEFMKHL